MNNQNQVIILMADDDEEDRMLAEDALQEARLTNELHFVEDGEELIDYLQRKGNYTHLKDIPLPGLILLDLNMPKKDGREALREIKTNPYLKSIPVVVLTTSSSDIDVIKTYDLGVNSFITKPVTFEGLVEVMKQLKSYWFEIVKLPPKKYRDDD